jgi:pimeloyl-ACP methyl ester carboxylesterase
MLLAGAPALARTPFSACRLEHPSGLVSAEAECARVQVPENPKLAAGRHLELFVARIPALSRKHSSEPLFLLAGGPGLGASVFYASAAPVFARIRRDRDIIIVDQRGTGKSHPLDCPFNESQMWEASDAETARVMRNCRDSLARDHDLSQYTTSVAVHDLDKVRAALGYARIHLYGSSYGTRVAQHYARRYPQHTGALILDGVVPPTRILGTSTPLDAERSLQRVLARCHEDRLCAQRFGDPVADYRQLRSHLQTNGPVKIALTHPTSGVATTLDFSSEMLAGALRLSGYSASQAALLPLALHLANTEKNYTPLAAQFLLAAADIDAVVAYGMHNSVVCTEDVPFLTESVADRKALAETFLGTAQIDSLRALCIDWPRGPIDTDFHQSLASQSPALILSGTADPVTPAYFGDDAMLGFKHAIHLKLPDQGHGQLGIPCMDRVMAEFLLKAKAGADTYIDTACIERVKPPPFFLSLNGPAP